jgi:WD40 repeat protein
VYSSGAILYQLLTGRPPFAAETLAHTLHLVLESQPVALRLLNARLPRDLETICSKCLEKDPRRRYSSARELADELGRFLRDEPICARPIGPAARLARWCWRKPAVALSLGMATALLLIVAIGSPIALVSIEHERRAAERARQEEAGLRVRAQAAERAAQRQLYTALFHQARMTVRSGELGQRVDALEAIRRAGSISNSVELRGEAFAAFGLVDLRFEREISTGFDCTWAGLDPKFDRVAVARGTNAVEIRSAHDQQLLATFPAGTGGFAAFGKWSPDGRFLMIGRRKSLGHAAEPSLELWDTSSARRALLLPQTPWGAFCFEPRHAWVLVSDVEDSIVLFDAESGREMSRFPVTGPVQHLEYSPDGQRFLAHYGDEDQWTTSLYDAASRSVRFSTAGGWMDGIAWDPQDRWIAFAARTGDVILRDPKTGTATLLGRHKKEARTVAFSPDGHFLFSGGEEQEIICWDLRAMQSVLNIPLQTTTLQFHADGKQCAVIGRIGVTLHAFESSVPARELVGDIGGSARNGVVSADGRWLAVTGGHHQLGLWDLTRESAAVVIAGKPNFITPLFAPDQPELLAFWNDGFARWHIEPGADAAMPPTLNPLPLYKPARIYSAGFVANTLLLGLSDGAMFVPPERMATGPGELFDIGVAQGQISPNGAWVAFRKREPHREEVYRPVPWKDWRFIPSDGEVLAEAFTPQSDALAVATYTSLTFIETNRWQPQRSFPVSLDRNARLIFSPNGRTFWLVRDARTAALHDSLTFRTLLPLPPGTIPIVLTPDGRHLVVSVEGRRLRLWDLNEVRARLRSLGLDWDGE